MQADAKPTTRSARGAKGSKGSRTTATGRGPGGGDDAVAAGKFSMEASADAKDSTSRKRSTSSFKMADAKALTRALAKGTGGMDHYSRPSTAKPKSFVRVAMPCDADAWPTVLPAGQLPVCLLVATIFFKTNAIGDVLKADLSPYKCVKDLQLVFPSQPRRVYNSIGLSNFTYDVTFREHVATTLLLPDIFIRVSRERDQAVASPHFYQTSRDYVDCSSVMNSVEDRI